MLHDIMKKYMNEIMNKEFHSTDKGFAIYQVLDKEFFIEALCMADGTSKKETGDFFREIIEMAKSHGCKCLTGNIDTTRENVTNRLLVQIRRGYKIVGNNGKYITVLKEI